jgi:flagellar biosynthesis/type III secretory pathway ATPase
MPQSDVEGVVPGTRVFPVEPAFPARQRAHPRRRPSDRARHLPVGPELLGRVLDGAGRPLDGLGPLNTPTARRSTPAPPTRWAARRSPKRWTWACARSTPC